MNPGAKIMYAVVAWEHGSNCRPPAGCRRWAWTRDRWLQMYRMTKNMSLIKAGEKSFS